MSLIRGIVCAYNPQARQEEMHGRDIPDTYQGAMVFKTGNESKYGFATVDAAKGFASDMARKNPGVTYTVYSAICAFESPPGDLINKVINNAGELVRDES